ncbi:MAG: helix-turn-helix domain-containing protein [Planctomycetota bacterium]|jgi:YesN/AraC family two-component response regulator
MSKKLKSVSKTREQLPAFVGGGEVSIDTSRNVHKASGGYHTHKGITELQYIHGGSGYYFVKDRLYRLKGKSLFIIHDTDTHAYVTEDKQSLIHKTSLLFSNDIINNLPVEQRKVLKKILTCSKTFLHQIDFSDKEASGIELFLSILKKDDEDKGENHDLIAANTIASLLLKINEILQKKSDTDTHETSRSLSAAVNYIDRNFRNSITLKDTSDAAGKSPFHISHIFKSELDLTFKEYLNARRIIEAKRLIEKNDNRKMFAIATDAGFSNLSSFNRNFKTVTAMSPSQYRELCQNNQQ